MVIDSGACRTSRKYRLEGPTDEVYAAYDGVISSMQSMLGAPVISQRGPRSGKHAHFPDENGARNAHVMLSRKGVPKAGCAVLELIVETENGNLLAIGNLQLDPIMEKVQKDTPYLENLKQTA